MPENPMSSFAEINETSSHTISVASDHVNRAHQSGENRTTTPSFLVDVESFPTRSYDKEHSKTPTSRIIRSFSTKGTFHGREKVTNLSHNSMESPRGSACSPKTPTALVAVENHIGSDHHHHYVTISGTGSGTKPCPRRLNSGIRRSRSLFAIDPRKVLFVFATLSSLGSLMLIYFTLAIKRMNEEGPTLEWR